MNNRLSGTFPYWRVWFSSLRNLLFALILLNALVAVASEFDWEIEGQLVYTDYTPEGHPRKQERQTFLVWIRGDDWTIRLTPVPEEESVSMAKYREVGTDGTNLYRITVFNPAFDSSIGRREELRVIDLLLKNATTMPAQEVKRLEKKKHALEQELKPKQNLNKSVNQAVGEVSPFPFPQFKPGDYAAFIWLANCSQRYLNAMGDQTLPQVWPYEHPMQLMTNNTVCAVVFRESTPDAPPKRVTFLNDGTDFDPFEKTLIRKPLPPPFDRGYTNAVYEVAAFTNLNGSEFPKSFSLSAYARRVDAKSNTDLWTFARFKGVTETIRPFCSRTNLIPDLPVATLIQDLRASKDQHGNRLQYVAKPGRWLTTTNLSELKSYERRILSEISLKIKRRRFLIPILLLTLAILGFFPVFRAWRNQSAAEKQNKQR